MTFISTWFVSQFWHQDALSVVGMKDTHKGTFVDVLFRKTNRDLVSALAIELLMIDDLWNAICIKQLNTIDELQVRTEHIDQFTTCGFFTRLFRVTCYIGMSKSKRHMRLSLVIGCAHNNLTTISSNARWCVDSDHVVADNLEISHFLATGEFNFSHTIKSGTIDGHGLVGDYLRREESLDAQAYVSRLGVFVRASCKCGSDENHRKQRA